MFTHVHDSIIVKMKELLSCFIRDVTSVFSRAYNHRYKRTGDLFQHRFGSASKKDNKKIREHLAYVYNNHVEKGLCKHPIEERWCFLAYARSNNPFSKPIDFNTISKKLKSSLRAVSKRAQKGKYLRYSILIKLLEGLSPEETEQFIDYTISQYMCIDFDAAASFYKDFDAMLISFSSSTGSEREFKEEFCAFSDVYYRKMEKIFRQNGWETSKIFLFSEQQKQEIIQELFWKYQIHENAIKKYLHA